MGETARPVKHRRRINASVKNWIVSNRNLGKGFNFYSFYLGKKKKKISFVHSDISTAGWIIDRWIIGRISFFSLVLEKLGRSLGTKWQVEENRFQNSSPPSSVQLQREPFIPLSTWERRSVYREPVPRNRYRTDFSFVSWEWSTRLTLETLNRNGRHARVLFLFPTRCDDNSIVHLPSIVTYHATRYVINSFHR